MAEGLTEKCVPYALHGDDAHIKGPVKLLILSVHSILVEGGDSLDTHIPITTVSYKDIVPGRTLDQIFEVVVWILDILEDGVDPLTDHSRAPWPAGIFVQRPVLSGARAQLCVSSLPWLYRIP